MKNKRYHIILSTTLFAIFLWASVNMGYQYQSSIDVPLEIERLPAGKAIRTPIPRILHLKFRGNGWRLATLLMGSNVRCILDLGTLPPAKKAITLTDVYERINLPQGVQAFDMKPDSIFVDLEEYAEKHVPLTLQRPLTFREGYGQVGAALFTPESVRVGGAESVLNEIAYWQISPPELENLKAPVDMDVAIADTTSYLLDVLPRTVHVKVNVQPFAEKVFSGLSVEILGSPPNREVILIPPKIEIVVRGGIDQLSNLTADDFRATVDYNVILSDTSGYARVEIMHPAGIQVMTRRPDRLQYIVRKRL